MDRTNVFMTKVALVACNRIMIKMGLDDVAFEEA
jgi:hypothetical protein